METMEGIAADDQTTMDELCGTRDAREQRTNDEGSYLVVEPRLKTQTEGGRETGSPSQGEDKVVGFGTGKNKGCARDKGGGDMKDAANNRNTWKEQAEIFASLEQRQRQGQR